MQKNLLLAVVLSAVVYIGWFAYVDKNHAPQRAQQAIAQKEALAQNSANPSQQIKPNPVNVPISSSQKNKVSHLESAAKNGETLSISAGKAEYIFDVESASVKDMIYQGPVAQVKLVPENSAGFFILSDGQQSAFKFKKGQKKTDSLEFVSTSKELSVKKVFTLSPNNGLNNLKMTFKNVSRSQITLPALNILLGPGLNTVESEKKENTTMWRSIYAFSQKGRKHPTVEKLKNESAENSPIWAGIDNRYFLAAMVEGSLTDTKPYGSEEKINGDKTPSLSVPFGNIILRAGEEYTFETGFYFGPKDYKFLQEVGYGLDRSVDFGFFAPLAKIADSMLGYFYKLTGNYGVAIVIISIIVQLLLSPLTYKSYKTMAVMKKMQPEMKSIQDRYKSDPQRMNQEMMLLYKKYGTNPLSGCLPMMLQIPVFFALFTALRNSWALHGAPFIFWIKDLSAKDPYYILPIVMGGIMFLQQALSPQTSDPTQATMMKWMPIIFTFMFLAFPSGLVIYWLINSLWGFAQNMYLQKKMA